MTIADIAETLGAAVFPVRVGPATVGVGEGTVVGEAVGEGASVGVAKAFG